ncbi:propanediol/glycerol family dehydratase large subunit [Natranaerofaba carboxydovora]|uniref:propanediol/glycerol family dehydratase large subunit n=1 Tax=Natranaerofaba carboxydovora TaxID=2742683 RepID=UPI001F12DEA1|nr:propanediol/glycerol family dehydratase large subunit [Natranaerofaba carboxydovora]UMZ73454.1 Glycerol dehydratase large subunit [Natranaerofaba carboxydovora]
MAKSLRYKFYDTQRQLALDGLAQEMPEKGLIAMDGPNDPDPSLKIENGVVVEMDGKKREEFDMIDLFIADYAIDQSIAEEVMEMDSLEISRWLVDINVPRQEIINYVYGMTPAKANEVLNNLDVVEMIMAGHKMRARKTPSIQSHITNRKDDPLQLAVDAASAGQHGFTELETTVGMGKFAPSNALAILIGSQVGRPGTLTQCAVEESLELTLGMRGLTSYAETVSNYGTERVFVDGDDTPWSKAFLGASYASRGLKLRFTSGTGAECVMGYSEGKSMLYLEIRCIMMTRATGIQGIQNGGISCVCMAGSVAGGFRALMAENLFTMMNDLEVVSGNDYQVSNSDMRRTARLLPQFLAGTDFIFSGYSFMPAYDDMFTSSSWNGEDLDEYITMQRDLRVDGGVKPVDEDEFIALRRKAGKVIKDVCDELGLPPFTDEAIEKCAIAFGSKETAPREATDNIKAADIIMDQKITGLDIVKALAKRGHEDVANNVLNMLKQRISGDYLQTSAILDENFEPRTAVNDANDYQGPGTGYRVEGKKWDEIKNIRQALKAEDLF